MFRTTLYLYTDIISNWFEACIVKDVNGRMKGCELFASYINWCKRNNIIKPANNTNFSTAFKEKYKCEPVKTKGFMVYKGFSEKDQNSSIDD